MGVFQKNSFFLSKKKIEKKKFALQGGVVPRGDCRGVLSPRGGTAGGSVVPQGGTAGGCRARKKKFPKKSQKKNWP